MQLLGGGIGYEFIKLETIDNLRFFINTPKESQNVNAARTKISGWAHSDEIAKLTLVVEIKSLLHRVDINQLRVDVSRHLKEKLGIEVKSDNHDFSLTIPRPLFQMVREVTGTGASLQAFKVFRPQTSHKGSGPSQGM